MEFFNCLIYVGLSSVFVFVFFLLEKNIIYVVYVLVILIVELCLNYIMFEVELIWLYLSCVVFYVFCIIYCFVGLVMIINFYMEVRSFMYLYLLIFYII